MLKLPILSKMFWDNLFRPIEYTIRAVIVSDVGKKRTENQDNFSFEKSVNENKSGSLKLKAQNTLLPQAYGIMDGMGGEKLGAQASLEAARFFSDIKEEILGVLPKLNEKGRVRLFTSLVHSLNEKVCQMASENNVKQSGTTFASAFFIKKSVYLVSVGDSPIFLIRKGRAMIQNKLDIMNLTVMENGEEKHMKGGLSQFLGMDANEYELAPHVTDLKPEAGDKFLLCSDGLTDYVSPEEIGEAVYEKPIEESIDILLNLALERGGRDNITVLLLDVECKKE